MSYNLLRVSSSEGVTVGPVLMGVSKPVHVLTPIASVRRIVNMVALAVVEAKPRRFNNAFFFWRRFSCAFLCRWASPWHGRLVGYSGTYWCLPTYFTESVLCTNRVIYYFYQ
ncbi:hypothetical protein IU399_28745 [Salmonella enterica subsp. enterica serovar Worthington]|nr:hypothetical protein [Salmonella enterica subsp. enterica serovar Worthington]